MAEDKWIYIPQHLPQDGKPIYALVTGLDGDARYFRVSVCIKQVGSFERFNELNTTPGSFYFCKLDEIGYFNSERVIAWMPYSDEVPMAIEPPKDIVDDFLKHQRAIDSVLAAYWRPVSAEKPLINTLVVVGVKLQATALGGVYCGGGEWATELWRPVSDIDKPVNVYPMYSDPFYKLRDQSQAVCWLGCDTEAEVDAHILARGLSYFCERLKARETGR